MKNIPSYHDFIGSIQSESEPITESSMGDYGQVNQLMVKLSKLLSSVHGTHQIAGQAMVYVIQSNFEEAKEIKDRIIEYTTQLQDMTGQLPKTIQSLKARIADLNGKDLPKMNESFSAGYFGAEIRKCQSEIERLNGEFERLDNAYVKATNKAIDADSELQSVQSEIAEKRQEIESFSISRFGDQAGSVDPSTDPEIRHEIKELERLEAKELNLMRKCAKIGEEAETALQARRSNRDGVRICQSRISELNASWKAAFMKR
jgi:archaellum component FlaC